MNLKRFWMDKWLYILILLLTIRFERTDGSILKGQNNGCDLGLGYICTVTNTGIEIQPNDKPPNVNLSFINKQYTYASKGIQKRSTSNATVDEVPNDTLTKENFEEVVKSNEVKTFQPNSENFPNGTNPLKPTTTTPENYTSKVTSLIPRFKSTLKPKIRNSKKPPSTSISHRAKNTSQVYPYRVNTLSIVPPHAMYNIDLPLVFEPLNIPITSTRKPTRNNIQIQKNTKMVQFNTNQRNVDTIYRKKPKLTLKIINRRRPPHSHRRTTGKKPKRPVRKQSFNSKSQKRKSSIRSRKRKSKTTTSTTTTTTPSTTSTTTSTTTTSIAPPRTTTIPTSSTPDPGAAFKHIMYYLMESNSIKWPEELLRKLSKLNEKEQKEGRVKYLPVYVPSSTEKTHIWNNHMDHDF